MQCSTRRTTSSRFSAVRTTQKIEVAATPSISTSNDRLLNAGFSDGAVPSISTSNTRLLNRGLGQILGMQIRTLQGLMWIAKLRAVAGTLRPKASPCSRRLILSIGTPLPHRPSTPLLAGLGGRKELGAKNRGYLPRVDRRFQRS